MHHTQPPTLKELRPHGTKTFPFATYKTPFCQKGTIVKHHWHDEIEMIYFSEGNFRLEINMEPFIIYSECLYFINPGELHSISTNTSSGFEEAIVFSPHMISFESYDTTQMQLIHPIQNGKLLFPRCILPDHPTFVPIRDTFVELMNMCRDDALTYQLYTKSSLLRILALLSASRLFVPAEKNYGKRVDELKKIITYIMENYREKIYIRDLAALVNMNEQYFCRFFKKAIGHSPMEYTNEYRIKQSMQLLKETDLPVTEICLECGFNNLGNFLKEFRKYTSTTPLKYRKNPDPGQIQA